MDKTYFVYILAGRSRNLYTGVTNNLVRGVVQHKEAQVPSFTSKYRIYRLVHFESFGDVRAAIVREKQIKSWRRENKAALIEAGNPTWEDLGQSGAQKNETEEQHINCAARAHGNFVTCSGATADPSLRSG